MPGLRGHVALCVLSAIYVTLTISAIPLCAPCSSVTCPELPESCRNEAEMDTCNCCYVCKQDPRTRCLLVPSDDGRVWVCRWIRMPGNSLSQIQDTIHTLNNSKPKTVTAGNYVGLNNAIKFRSKPEGEFEVSRYYNHMSGNNKHLLNPKNTKFSSENESLRKMFMLRKGKKYLEGNQNYGKYYTWDKAKNARNPQKYTVYDVSNVRRKNINANRDTSETKYIFMKDKGRFHSNPAGNYGNKLLWGSRNKRQAFSQRDEKPDTISGEDSSRKVPINNIMDIKNISRMSEPGDLEYTVKGNEQKYRDLQAENKGSENVMAERQLAYPYTYPVYPSYPPWPARPEESPNPFWKAVEKIPGNIAYGVGSAITNGIASVLGTAVHALLNTPISLNGSGSFKMENIPDHRLSKREIVGKDKSGLRQLTYTNSYPYSKYKARGDLQRLVKNPVFGGMMDGLYQGFFASWQKAEVETVPVKIAHDGAVTNRVAGAIESGAKGLLKLPISVEENGRLELENMPDSYVWKRANPQLDADITTEIESTNHVGDNKKSAIECNELKELLSYNGVSSDFIDEMRGKSVASINSNPFILFKEFTYVKQLYGNENILELLILKCKLNSTKHNNRKLLAKRIQSILHGVEVKNRLRRQIRKAKPPENIFSTQTISDGQMVVGGDIKLSKRESISSIAEENSSLDCEDPPRSASQIHEEAIEYTDEEQRSRQLNSEYVMPRINGQNPTNQMQYSYYPADGQLYNSAAYNPGYQSYQQWASRYAQPQTAYSQYQTPERSALDSQSSNMGPVNAMGDSTSTPLGEEDEPEGLFARLKNTLSYVARIPLQYGGQLLTDSIGAIINMLISNRMFSNEEESEEVVTSNPANAGPENTTPETTLTGRLFVAGASVSRMNTWRRFVRDTARENIGPLTNHTFREKEQNRNSTAANRIFSNNGSRILGITQKIIKYTSACIRMLTGYMPTLSVPELIKMTGLPGSRVIASVIKVIMQISNEIFSSMYNSKFINQSPTWSNLLLSLSDAAWHGVSKATRILPEVINTIGDRSDSKVKSRIQDEQRKQRSIRIVRSTLESALDLNEVAILTLTQNMLQSGCKLLKSWTGFVPTRTLTYSVQLSGLPAASSIASLVRETMLFFSNIASSVLESKFVKEEPSRARLLEGLLDTSITLVSRALNYSICILKYARKAFTGDPNMIITKTRGHKTNTSYLNDLHVSLHERMVNILKVVNYVTRSNSVPTLIESSGLPMAERFGEIMQIILNFVSKLTSKLLQSEFLTTEPSWDTFKQTLLVASKYITIGILEAIHDVLNILLNELLTYKPLPVEIKTESECTCEVSEGSALNAIQGVLVATEELTLDKLLEAIRTTVLAALKGAAAVTESTAVKVIPHLITYSSFPMAETIGKSVAYIITNMREVSRSLLRKYLLIKPFTKENLVQLLLETIMSVSNFIELSIEGVKIFFESRVINNCTDQLFSQFKSECEFIFNGSIIPLVQDNLKRVCKGIQTMTNNMSSSAVSIALTSSGLSYSDLIANVITQVMEYLNALSHAAYGSKFLAEEPTWENAQVSFIELIKICITSGLRGVSEVLKYIAALLSQDLVRSELSLKSRSEENAYSGKMELIESNNVKDTIDSILLSEGIPSKDDTSSASKIGKRKMENAKKVSVTMATALSIVGKIISLAILDNMDNVYGVSSYFLPNNQSNGYNVTTQKQSVECKNLYRHFTEDVTPKPVSVERGTENLRIDLGYKLKRKRRRVTLINNRPFRTLSSVSRGSGVLTAVEEESRQDL